MPESGEIVAADRRLRLEPKVMEVLELLAVHPGRVVSKQQLLDAVWPDCIVVEDVVWRAISELRTALGDDSRSPRFIETLPRRGDRLVTPPSPPAARDRRRSRRSWWLAAAAALAVATTIAVSAR